MNKIKIFDKYYDVLEKRYVNNTIYYDINFDGNIVLADIRLCKIIKNELYYIQTLKSYHKIVDVVNCEYNILRLKLEDNNIITCYSISDIDIRNKIIQSILND